MTEDTGDEEGDGVSLTWSLGAHACSEVVMVWDGSKRGGMSSGLVLLCILCDLAMIARVLVNCWYWLEVSVRKERDLHLSS